MTISTRQRGFFFMLAASMLWGTTGTAQCFAPGGADSLSLGALRLTLGGLALLLMAAGQGVLSCWRQLNKGLLLTVALGLAAYQVLFFNAVRITGVAAGTVVALGSASALGGLLGHVFLREKLRGHWCLATALAVLGSIFLGLGSENAFKTQWIGIVLALAAGATYATYSLVLKKLLEHGPEQAVMAMASCGGALMLLPFLLWRCDPAWLMQGRSVAVLLHLGLLTLALAYWLFARGLRLLPVSTAMTVGLAEPATATLLGLFVVGEHLRACSFVGLCLVFGGLIVLSLPEKTDAKPEKMEQRV